MDELYDFVKDKDYCYICGKPLDWSYGSKGRGMKHNSPSLDRINNENYLDLSNIQILCCNCNTSKGNKTILELVSWAEQVIKVYKE